MKKILLIALTAVFSQGVFAQSFINTEALEKAKKQAEEQARAAVEKITFKKEKIILDKKVFKVDIADTSEKHQYGMMFRKKLEPDEGMLFVFSNEEPRTFWMKNTFVPLSIGFFNSKKELIDIQEMEAVKSEVEAAKSYTSKGPAQYVLEMPAGWFEKKKFKIGSKLVYGK